MRFLIHACPQRMWYVQDFLIPSLLAQGAAADEVEVWNDSEGRGNLIACMLSFADRKGDGGTWHIQDDALLCRDFVKRCRELDDGLVYGFCSEQFTDDPAQSGRVHMPDAWHSFQCVRIPDAWARECAAWFYAEGRYDPNLRHLAEINRFDDYFFREFCQRRHGRDMAYNARPCLTEHVDMLIGGSVVNEWRGYWVRAQWFDDEDLVDELRERLRTSQ